MGLEGRRATRRPFAILPSNPTIDTTGCSVQRRYVVSYTENRDSLGAAATQPFQPSRSPGHHVDGGSLAVILVVRSATSRAPQNAWHLRPAAMAC